MNDSAIDNIRLRPAMYIGKTDERGIEHLICELVSNGIDQFLAGAATRVSIDFDGSFIRVSDDGPGLPFDEPGPGQLSLAECYFTQLHTTATADGHYPHVHLNYSGFGAVVVSALSSEMEISSHRCGRRWSWRLVKGFANGPVKSKPSEGRGTTIRFVPDPEVLSATQPRWQTLRHRLFETAHLFPGIRLGLNQERFYAPGGLLQLAAFESPNTSDEFFDPLPQEKTFELNTEIDGIAIRAAALGEAKDCIWRSWCNGLNTYEHGTHVKGFKGALRRHQWMPKIAMIHVIFTTATFHGPVKRKLKNEEVARVVRQAVNDALKNR